MNELRKMLKKVNKYDVLIYNDPEKIKSNCDFYFNDVKFLHDKIDSYIDEKSDLFRNLCDVSVEIWNLSTNNIFLRIKRAICMHIINHYLNLYEYELKEAGILQGKLETITKRIEQFRYLT